MKHVTKLLLLVLLTGGSLSLMAASNFHNPNEEPAAKESERVIRNYFKFPQILLPVKENTKVEQNKVEVLFTTDKSGKVNFVLAKTENPALKKEIEKQFSALSLLQLKSGVVHKVVLSFRTI